MGLRRAVAGVTCLSGGAGEPGKRRDRRAGGQRAGHRPPGGLAARLLSARRVLAGHARVGGQGDEGFRAAGGFSDLALRELDQAADFELAQERGEVGAQGGGVDVELVEEAGE